MNLFSEGPWKAYSNGPHEMVILDRNRIVLFKSDIPLNEEARRKTQADIELVCNAPVMYRLLQEAVMTNLSENTIREIKNLLSEMKVDFSTVYLAKPDLKPEEQIDLSECIPLEPEEVLRYFFPTSYEKYIIHKGNTGYIIYDNAIGLDSYIIFCGDPAKFYKDLSVWTPGNTAIAYAVPDPEDTRDLIPRNEISHTYTYDEIYDRFSDRIKLDNDFISKLQKVLRGQTLGELEEDLDRISIDGLLAWQESLIGKDSKNV